MVLSGYRLLNQQKLPNSNPPAEHYTLCWLSPKSLRKKNRLKKKQQKKNHLLFETECACVQLCHMQASKKKERSEKHKAYKITVEISNIANFR